MNLSLVERQDLALSCLDELSPVIGRYAKHVHISFEEGYQEAAALILTILDKPYVQVPVVPYVARAIRFHFIDLGKKLSKHDGVLSLDMAAYDEDECETTLGDLLPSSYCVEPLTILLAKERLLDLYRYTVNPPPRRQAARIYAAWQTAAFSVFFGKQALVA